MSEDERQRCDRCGHLVAVHIEAGGCAACEREGVGSWGKCADLARINRLIEASSLGTPEAKAARDSVSDEIAARIVARARELER